MTKGKMQDILYILYWKLQFSNWYFKIFILHFSKF